MQDFYFYFFLLDRKIVFCLVSQVFLVLTWWCCGDPLVSKNVQRMASEENQSPPTWFQIVL